MNTPTPPPRSNGLSWYLANAGRIERMNALNLPAIFDLLEQLHTGFRSALGAAQQRGDSLRMTPRFLLVRAHGSCFAATRLALSGQVVEAFAPLRGAIEASWYALHMYLDPLPLTRVEIWGHRHDDEHAKQRCQNEFTIGRVRRTHEAHDPAVAAILYRLYGETIDLGAHPNPLSIVGVLEEKETPDGTTFDMAMLTTDRSLVVPALNRVIDIGIGALKTFGLIFPIEFRTAKVGVAIDRLIATSRATFQA